MGVVVTQRAQPVLSVTPVLPDGMEFQAVFGRRQDWVAAGMVYTVAFSADLVDWESGVAEARVVASDGTVDAVTVPYPPSLSTGSAAGRKPQYFRVVVEVLP